MGPAVTWISRTDGCGEWRRQRLLFHFETLSSQNTRTHQFHLPQSLRCYFVMEKEKKKSKTQVIISQRLPKLLLQMKNGPVCCFCVVSFDFGGQDEDERNCQSNEESVSLSAGNAL